MPSAGPCGMAVCTKGQVIAADIELPRGEKASGVASLGIGNERRIQRGESAGPMLRQQQMKIVRVNANAQSHVYSFQTSGHSSQHAAPRHKLPAGIILVIEISFYVLIE